jgi:hypothetical protein
VAFGVSKNTPGLIQGLGYFEKKNRQVNLSIGLVLPSVRKGPDTTNLFLFFLALNLTGTILSLFPMKNPQKLSF